MLGSRRTTTRRNWFLPFFLIALCLLLMRLLVPQTLMPLERWLMNISTPFITFFQQATENIYNQVNDLDTYLSLKEQNEKLQQKAKQSERLFLENERLRDENERLSALLDVVKPFPGMPLTTKVLTDRNAPFGASILIMAGAAHGVAVGHAVVDHVGLVGRVVNVYENVARVLLLTDYTFRLPVYMGSKEEHLLIRGGEGQQLAFLINDQGQTRLPEGEDFLFTSGRDGLFPPDIPVAHIKVSGEEVHISPVAHLQNLKTVVVLRRNVDGLLPQPPAPNGAQP